MRTRQDKAEQLYINCLDLGCGFRHEGDKVIVLAPCKRSRKGQEHPTLQKVLDRYQDVMVTLVPRHGVQPEAWRPATTESIKPVSDDSKMALIGRGIEGAEKQLARKKAVKRNSRTQWKRVEVL